MVFQDDIVNQTGAALLCIQVNKGKTLNAPVIRVVIMAQKLIAAADSDHYAVVLHIVFEIFLYAAESVADQHLLPVGAAAQKHNIKGGKINVVLKLEFHSFCLDASPLAAFHHALDISPVPVQIQEVRI